MADCREEQQDELEVLCMMFGEDDVTVVQGDYDRGAIVFSVHVGSSHGDEGEGPACDLHVTLPGTYPHQAPPSIDIRNLQNMAGRHIRQLKDRLKSKSQDLVGSVMMSELIECAQTWLDALGSRGGVSQEDELEGVGSTSGAGGMSARELLAARDASKDKAKEGSRYDESRLAQAHTPVTRENFLEWKRRFDQELVEAQQKRVSASSSSSSSGGKKGAAAAGAVQRKLTGRELFEDGTGQGLDLEEEFDFDEFEAEVAGGLEEGAAEVYYDLGEKEAESSS